MTNNWLQSIMESIRTSHLLRGLLIGFLILLLLIPISMISGVIWEREEARNEAVKEVTDIWGGDQSLWARGLLSLTCIMGRRNKLLGIALRILLVRRHDTLRFYLKR